jgi:hypothetical protein
MRNTSAIGNISEAKVLAALTEKGYIGPRNARKRHQTGECCVNFRTFRG